VRSILNRPFRKRKAAKEGAGVEFKHVEAAAHPPTQGMSSRKEVESASEAKHILTSLDGTLILI
jgi:hypothetical protein